MKNCKKSLLLLLSVWTVSPIFAQHDDFGIWTSVGVDKKLTKQWSVEAGAEFRSAENLQTVSRWGGSLGVNYKVNSFLKFGAGYAYLYDQNAMETKVNLTKNGKVNGYNVDRAFWQGKHRTYFDMVGSFKTGRWKFSLRERYQFTHSVATDCDRMRFRDKVQPGYMGDIYEWNGEQFSTYEEVVDRKQGKDKHYLRTRGKVEYNIPKCPFNPYVSYELSNDLADGLDLDKTRLIVGTEWKITKKHILSMGYLYQHGTDGDHDGGRHVLDLGYTFSF